MKLIKNFIIFVFVVLVFSLKAQDNYKYSGLQKEPSKINKFIALGKQFNSKKDKYLSYSFMLGTNNSPSLIGIRLGNIYYKTGWWINGVCNNINFKINTADQTKLVYSEQWIGISDISFNKRYFINPLISAYYGIGYGTRNFYYSYIKPEKGYIVDKTQSVKGVSIEFGTMLTIKDFVISVGANLLKANPKYFNISFGLGLAF